MLHLLEHNLAHATRHLGDRAEPVSENAREKKLGLAVNLFSGSQKDPKRLMMHEMLWLLKVKGMQSDLETVKHLIRVLSFHGISGRPLEGSKPLVGHAAYIYIYIACVCVSKYKSVYT